MLPALSATAALLTLALAGPGTAADGPALGREAGFDESDWSAIEAGRVVARALDTAGRSEVLSIAGMAVQVETARFLECVRDPGCLRSGEGVIEIGRVQAMPSAADFQAFHLEPQEVEQLGSCRVGKCMVRLSESDIGRFRGEIDWSSPGHASEAARVFREVLAAHAAAYVAGGNRDLPEYRDKVAPVPVGARLGDLLRQPNWVFARAPELLRYLEGFPHAESKRVDAFLFWCKEAFWRKPVVALNHVAIHEKADPAWRFVFVASKQLYASHYHEASLELMALATHGASGRSYVLFHSRTRADVRPSGFNWLERRLLSRLVRRRLEARFEAMRAGLEAATRPARARSAFAGSAAFCID